MISVNSYGIRCDMKPKCPKDSARKFEALNMIDVMDMVEKAGWWIKTQQVLCPQCRMDRLARLAQPPKGTLKLGINK
jgi:hypothetical protein